MRIVEGNSYVCLKEWKDTKGRPVSVGAICYATKRGTLTGYNAEGIYSDIEPLDNYEEYFTLYEEAPYNKENRELRERYAGMALQGISSQESLKRAEPKRVAEVCVTLADALIAELEKGGVKE